MKRHTLLLTVLLGLALMGHAVVAGSGDPATTNPVEERAQQLVRERALIETLVETGLQLSEEQDWLKRADHCNRIAAVLGKEIKTAVNKKDSTRAALLGDQMQAILVWGVADNLNMARATLEPNSLREPELLKVGEKVADVTRTIEEEIARAEEPEKMKPALQAVAKGKVEVEQALKGKGKGKGPPPKKTK